MTRDPAPAGKSKLPITNILENDTLGGRVPFIHVIPPGSRTVREELLAKPSSNHCLHCAEYILYVQSGEHLIGSPWLICTINCIIVTEPADYRRYYHHDFQERIHRIIVLSNTVSRELRLKPALLSLQQQGGETSNDEGRDDGRDCGGGGAMVGQRGELDRVDVAAAVAGSADASIGRADERHLLVAVEGTGVLGAAREVLEQQDLLVNV